MKKIIYFFVMIFFITSCSNNKHKTGNTKLEKIDYSDLCFTNKLQLPKDFNYKFVPLETNDNCLIGDVNKVLYFNNRIYILDFTITKTIYVFNLNGLFLFKISPEGGSAKECIHLVDFEIFNNNLILLSSFDQKLLFYDLNGNYIKTLKLEDYGNVSLKFLTNNLFVTSACDNGNRVIDYWTFKGKKNKSIKVKYLPEKKSCRSRRPLTVNKNNIYINFAYSDTIFKVTKNNFFPSIVFNFGSKHLPIEKIKTEKKLSILDLDSRYSSIYDYSITNNYIYTDISRGKYVYAVLYNRKTHKLKAAKSFTIQNYDLSLLVGDLKNGFIFTILSDHIVSVNKKKHGKMFKNMKVSDNPVIVLVTEKNKTLDTNNKEE